MKRLVALAAASLAVVAALALAGCQDRAGRDATPADQVGNVQTTPASHPPAAPPAATDANGVDAELASVDAQLSDVDSDLSAVDKTPEDAD
jgi:hypothetical protein